MGKSLKRAAELVHSIEATGWGVFDDIAELSNEHQTAASSIRDTLCDALQADEHATALVSTVKDCQAKAVRLLAEIAKSKVPPKPPATPTPPETPTPTPLPPGKRLVAEDSRQGLPADEAREVLENLQKRMDDGPA